MSVIPEVNSVRSLRKDLRDLQLSPETTLAIASVHESLRSGIDSQGWMRVDWKNNGGGGGLMRSSRHPGGGGGGGGGGGYSGGAGGSDRSGGGSGSYRSFNSRYSHGHGHIHNQYTSQAATQDISANATVAAPPAPAPAPVKVHTRYVSKFKSSTDKIDDTILNTIILGKLNKFSAINYDEIKGFMCQILDSGETDFLKEFMKLVFEKATTEEIFCPLYARLLSELSSKYTILLSEMSVLYAEYMKIFEEISEKDCTDYDEFVKRNSQKKYRLGYSQFLAELIKHNVIDNEMLMRTVSTIVNHLHTISQSIEHVHISEEYADCLVRIARAVLSEDTEITRTICRSIHTEFIDRIKVFTVKSPDSKLSMKARFAMLDVYESICKNVKAE